MMQQAAISLGIDVRLLAEGPEVSAAQVVPATTVGDYTHWETLERFAAEVDVVTFDHEHVPTAHLHRLSQQVAIRPGPQALVYAQDKAQMRRRLSELGVAIPGFAVTSTPAELIDAGESLGWPLIAKTSRGGYDGKGVWKLPDAAHAQLPFEGLASPTGGEDVVIVAEEFIDFTRELSAVVVRSASGQAVAYPLSQTTQSDGICVETISPAPGLTDDEAVRLQSMALRIAGELGVVGVLAVELMAAPDGRVVVNELAMRPHNTAHWTIDGARTSQFENHIRAVLDLPLGDPAMRGEVAVMANILGGSEPDLTGALVHTFARDRDIRVHLYGKDVRAGRKVGHVTAIDTHLDWALRRARHAAGYLMGDPNA